jgi:putative ABC transport system permease protein
MVDLLASAWLSITRHRLRSLLAMAGVAVGVCALTSIMSVEHAWRRAVWDFFTPLDLEMVRVAIPGGADWREAMFRRADLEPSDAAAIEKQCPAASSAAFVTSSILWTEGDVGGMDMVVYAVPPDLTKTLPDTLKEGRPFSAEESARQAPVCVLSYAAALQLFGPQSAVGQQVRVQGHRFRVVGVASGNRHPDISDTAVYLPETWTRMLLQAEMWSTTTQCFVRTRDPKAAVGQIERLMRQRLGGRGSEPFTHSLWQVREAALHARDRATAYSALAGLCALLAAGIGIASLLFVSVAERAREIGVCRALGASRARVYGEYVLAALLLSGGGAVIGALAGIPAAAAGAFATRWQPVLDPITGEFLTQGGRAFPKLPELTLSVSWEAVATAVVLALLAGVAAALTPAAEAASLSPALAIAQRTAMPRRARQVLTCLQVAFGVIVLVVLTSYYGLMESEQQAEARHSLGQDTVFALADPIVALRQPVEQRYIDACSDALANTFRTAEASARLRQGTPLLTNVVPAAVLALDAGHGGRLLGRPSVTFTTAEAFGCAPELVGEARRRAEEAFNAGEAVAVVNPEVARRLFEGRDPIGQSLSIAGKPFKVVAVRPNPPGSSGMEDIWVPMAYYAALRPRALSASAGFSLNGATRVEGRPVDPRRYAEAVAQLRRVLLPMLPEEYRKGIFFGESIPETTKQFIFQSAAVARRGAIGALAVLLVALIGLANMLLVSVHDELRETGVRRALGATRPEVFLHFLCQGVLLSALGACAGLAIGAAVCGVTRSWAGMPLTVSAFWAAAGAMATVLAGTLTSVAPAVVGARVQPVEALRYE